jgi:hypothetical protein
MTVSDESLVREVSEYEDDTVYSDSPKAKSDQAWANFYLDLQGVHGPAKQKAAMAAQAKTRELMNRLTNRAPSCMWCGKEFPADELEEHEEECVG